MTELRESRGALLGRRLLVVGAGGLGCPALLGLADSGATLVLADDDVVELGNLHRQLLFRESDLGRDKLDAARDALLAEGVPESRIELVRSRFLPDNALSLARSVDLVLEGSDNFATKFLVADACHLAERPVVHGAAVRLQGTVWCVAAQGKPCYRCLFEDVPPGAQQNCAEAGVLGPVVGLCGALMAELALSLLCGADAHLGHVLTIDGRRNRLRRVGVSPRPECPLCGAAPSIFEIEETRYTAPSCAA
ncbi:MAG: HesA/MoeB/ThiF family protein [Polyangiaceae bacterium]